MIRRPFKGGKKKAARAVRWVSIPLSVLLFLFSLFGFAPFAFALQQWTFSGGGASSGGGGGGGNVTVDYWAYDISLYGDLVSASKAVYDTSTGRPSVVGNPNTESYRFLNSDWRYKTVSFAYTRRGTAWSKSYSHIPAWGALWINYVYQGRDGAMHRVNLFPNQSGYSCLPQYEWSAEGGKTEVWATNAKNVIPIGGYGPLQYGKHGRGEGGIISEAWPSGNSLTYRVIVTPFFTEPSDPNFKNAAVEGWKAKVKQGPLPGEYFPFAGNYSGLEVNHGPEWVPWISSAPLERIWKEEGGKLDGYVEAIFHIFNYRGNQLDTQYAVGVIDFGFILSASQKCTYFLPFPDVTPPDLIGPLWWMDDGEWAEYRFSTDKVVDWSGWNALAQKDDYSLVDAIFKNELGPQTFSENHEAFRTLLSIELGREPTEEEILRKMKETAQDILWEAKRWIRYDASSSSLSITPSYDDLGRPRWVGIKTPPGRLLLRFDRPTPPGNPIVVSGGGKVSLSFSDHLCCLLDYDGNKEIDYRDYQGCVGLALFRGGVLAKDPIDFFSFFNSGVPPSSAVSPYLSVDVAASSISTHVISSWLMPR